ncbi:colicin E1 family microcin immunity protein [Pseudomonas sp. CBZ-4]|uniref:colicin E1 family microcin immunity protein n=1 Tax=Pseudomonas sp. CBZ-4 TaxID=1163065 RepID=UPI000364E9FB|nr:colicin E1 family microcin immunity protein [Pseudomonas sp. CBZ-4]
MEKSYFFKNLVIGVVLFFICVFVFRSSDDAVVFFVVSGVNAFLFPFSKRLVEDAVFRYTKKGVWETGPSRTAAANGGHALLYSFYFAFAIPLGVLFLMLFYMKK